LHGSRLPENLLKNRGKVDMDANGARTCMQNAGFIAEYLAELRQRNCSGRTVQIYGTAVRKLQEFLQGCGVRRLQDVCTDHLDKYRLALDERHLKPATVTVYLRAVGLLFRHLEHRGMILINPADSLPPMRQIRRLLPVPSEADIRTLLAQPDTSAPLGVRDRALLETAYGTAGRLQELVRVRIPDLDLAQGTVRLLGKGSRERVVPQGAPAQDWLRAYLEHARPALLDGAQTDALWVSYSGRPLDYVAVRTVFRRHVSTAKLEIPVTPHSCRRACASHMLRRGAHPVQIQALLGHASMRCLSQYLGVTITEIRRMHEQSKPGA